MVIGKIEFDGMDALVNFRSKFLSRISQLPEKTYFSFPGDITNLATALGNSDLSIKEPLESFE